MIKAILTALAIALGLIAAPAPTVLAPDYSSDIAAECMCDRCEWDAYYGEAYCEYADEFTALFNSYTYKLSKNGRSMVNGKFVAMPKEK